MIRPSLILAGLAVLVSAAPAAAAGPKLTFAASSDRDGDGRVDSVSLRFSGKVKGRGKYSVAGMRVISAGKARGRAVRLRVAEGNSCDLGLLPRVSYRSGLKRARGRKVRPSRVDMERRDRRAPRLTCAVTTDADADGHVDGLLLTWSKRVKRRRGGRVLGAGLLGPRRVGVQGPRSPAAPRRARQPRQRLDSARGLFPRQAGRCPRSRRPGPRGRSHGHPRRRCAGARLGAHERFRQRRTHRHDLRLLLGAAFAPFPGARASRAHR